MRASPRATHLCAKHRASAEAEVRGNAKYTMDEILRKLFPGTGFRKTETDFFEKFFGLGFRPAGGCGRNAGRISFLAGGQRKRDYPYE